MHDLLIAGAVVAIVAYVIGRQVLGEPIRAKRLLVLPVVLAVIGAVDVAHAHVHGHATSTWDIVLIAISGAVAVGIGLGQGRAMRLSSKDGYLWGQMPVQGLWWWAALIGSRVLVMLIAAKTGAHVAASTEPILLALGLNRIGQAVIVGLHSVRTGIPFAPDKDRHGH